MNAKYMVLGSKADVYNNSLLPLLLRESKCELNSVDVHIIYKMLST